MKQKNAYVIDLTKIDGEGDFSCPRCGATISPDDCTEDNYTLGEAKVNANGLEEIIIFCNNCESQIHLTGFSFLEDSSRR